MTTQTTKRRGRPAKYVTDRTGKPVVGLSFDKSTGQYYTTHQKPRIRFGSELDLAIARFRHWQKSGDKLKLIETQGFVPDDVDVEEGIAQGWLRPEDRGRTIPWPVKVDADAFYLRVRELLLDNPRAFAERVGIPELAALHDLRPPEPSLPLADCWTAYASRKTRRTGHWQSKMRAFWSEFAKAVGVSTLAEVNREAVASYHDSVWATAKAKGYSPTWVNHRLSGVRAVLSAALKTGRDVDNVRRVLDLTAIFERQQTSGVNPKPIARDDFAKLLATAKGDMRAILLVMLNAALYPSEAAALRWSELDLDAGTFASRRRKTGIVRVAKLWKRTIAALRKVKRHAADAVFVTTTGTPLSANVLSKRFAKLRKAAGVDASVTLDRIRDGAYTAAVAAGVPLEEVKLLAGHSTGISDAYAARRPDMVAKACRAIEQAYFGGSSD